MVTLCTMEWIKYPLTQEYQLSYYYLVFNKKNKIIDTHTHTTISIQKPKLIG